MADRPILFSAPMVRAILREIEQPGTGKTQTRRIHFTQNPVFKPICDNGCEPRLTRMCILETCGRRTVTEAKVHVSDRLWVRETWSGLHAFRDTPPSQRESAATPDGPLLRDDIWYWADGSPTGGDYERPRPGIHMPRWASRLTLVVTNVRVQRLRYISVDDAVAEGVDTERCCGVPSDSCGTHLGGCCGQPEAVDPIEEYRDLWDEINGPGAWDANPWVAAYTFTPHLINIDQMEPQHG